MTITYTTEDPAPKYAKAIRAAKNIGELIASISRFSPAVDDALEAARKLTANQFSEFKREIRNAHKPMSTKKADEFNSKWGAIAMPMKLLIASMLAFEYGAPWGTAFIRCQQDGWPMLAKPRAKKSIRATKKKAA